MDLLWKGCHEVMRPCRRANPKAEVVALPVVFIDTCNETTPLRVGVAIT